MEIQESVIIQRRPEDVFAFLEVRSNDAEWMTSVLTSEWLDPGGGEAEAIGIGRRGRMVMNILGRDAEFIDQVTEYEPGRRIAHRTVSGPMPLDTACICELVEGGACRATVVGATDRLPGGLIGRAAAPLFARAIRRAFRADLAMLKNILEPESAARQ